jgi:ArsR family transcriptional regulator, arsenate/arsenite/antimonite-responsive transcriptional repressor
MHKNYMRAMPREWHGMARVFVALGDEHRQRILLTFDKGEELNVGAIAAVSTLSRPAVSHHLKILHGAGLLKREKRGKEIYFRVDREALVGALATVLDYVKRNA